MQMKYVIVVKVPARVTRRYALWGLLFKNENNSLFGQLATKIIAKFNFGS